MRVSGEDGASAIEFALILPILLMLLFGILTGGLALTEQQQLNHGAREGARYGATLDEFPASTAYDRVAKRTQSAARGLLRVDTALMCVAYHDGSSFGRQWYEIGDPDPVPAAAPADPDAECPDALAGESQPRVQVSMRIDARIEGILFRNDVRMAADAVAVHEGS